MRTRYARYVAICPPKTRKGVRISRGEDTPAAFARAIASASRTIAFSSLGTDPWPARLHGDLWAGNVLWSPTGAVLIGTLLDELERRGRANGLTGLARLRGEEIRAREPHAAGIAALWVPETGIANYPGVAAAYGRRIEARGCTVWTGARVHGVRPDGPGLVVETARGAVACRLLVNCAGLQSDRVARLCGAEVDVRIIPFRGEYYELVPERRSLVRGLIYPVPDPRFPFLGVHLTRMVGGGVEAGPNAVIALKREGYRWSDISPKDMASAASWPGLWRLAARFWRTAGFEVWRSLVKSAFVRDLQRLVPAICDEDLHRAGAGVRAQALERNGALVDDFRIVRSDHAIHVLNAPSPAATASLAIGRTIAEMAVEA